MQPMRNLPLFVAGSRTKQVDSKRRRGGDFANGHVTVTRPSDSEGSLRRKPRQCRNLISTAPLNRWKI